MKPWFNVNLEPLTCIITHGNSVKVAQSQTHFSCIGVFTSHAYACGCELESQTAAFESSRHFRTQHRQVSMFKYVYLCHFDDKKMSFKGYNIWLQGDFNICCP